MARRLLSTILLPHLAI